MGQLMKVFQVNRQGFNLTRGLVIVGVMLVPLIVLSAINQEKYWLSVSFGALFVGISDPGGPYGIRLLGMAEVVVAGGLLTALGFAIGGGPWGIVVVATFAVTVFSGLTLNFGVHRFTAAVLVNVWFLIAISVPAGEHLDLARSDWSG